MWWWFIIGVFIIFLLLSGSSWLGYRRSYYGPGSAIGLLVILFLLLCSSSFLPVCGGVGMAGGGKTGASQAGRVLQSAAIGRRHSG